MYEPCNYVLRKRRSHLVHKTDRNQSLQASSVSEELMKTEYDAARLIYNRFKSAISYKPTIATVLSPDVSTSVPLYQTSCSR